MNWVEFRPDGFETPKGCGDGGGTGAEERIVNHLSRYADRGEYPFPEVDWLCEWVGEVLRRGAGSTIKG